MFLQLSVHDSLDTLHVFGGVGTLELLVTEERELVEHLARTSALLLALEFGDGGLKILLHNVIGFGESSFSKMMALSSSAITWKGQGLTY